MNKSMIVGTVLGAVAVTAVGALGGYTLMDKDPKFAEVLSAKPVTKLVSVPKEECHDEVVTHQKPVKDENQLTGTAIGAVIGGLLGNQLGGGSGKKVATVAGAVAGGYAGKKTQGNMQKNNTYTTTETRCEVIQQQHSKLIGYDVEYRLDDVVSTIRMDHKPGKQIPVENGELVLVKGEESSSI